jgi:hypothetical protein
VIAALDKDGKDSGRLALSTSTLTASDIKDSAKSKDISVGVSASINNVTDKNTRSANLPVVDGSFASSTFKQDTKATIGQGTLTVGVPTENVTINRDTDQSQVVTKDKQTGFTVYVDVAAAKELVSLVKGVAGNKDAVGNSVILQGVQAIRERPLGLVTDALREINALGNTVGQPGTRNDSQLEKLFNQLGSLVRSETSDVAARAENLRQDFRADAIAKGEDPVQVDIAVAELERNNVFVAVAQVQRQDAREGERLRIRPSTVQAVSEQLVTAANAVPQPGAPPAPQADTPPENETIIVTACRRSDCQSGVPSLVHNGVAAIGGAFNGASPITQRIITGGIGVLSDGPVGYVVGEVVGGIANRVAPDQVARLGGAVNSLFVAGDAFFQSRAFNPVRSENDRQDNSNGTANAVTGTGLVVSALPIISVIRRLPSGTPDAPNVDAPDVRAPDARPLNEPEADLAGRGAVRPDLVNHLENPVRSGRQISGGHNADNFYTVLRQEGGTVVSTTQLAPGITEIQYRLPGSNRSFPKTVYDPALYPNVPALAQDAAVRALRQYNGTAIRTQEVTIGGIRFRADISVRNGTPTVNTVYPIGRGQ